MQVLPYRADPGDLRRYLLALARGRTRAQLKEQEFSPKTLDGVAAAADAFGLTVSGNGALSPLGRRLATASGEASRDVAAELVESFDAYAGAVDAARRAGGDTTLEWIQQWWAAHGFGTSDSNRYEAAPVFARFVEAAGLGRFVQGRKGRQSRIVWRDAAARGDSADVASSKGQAPQASSPSDPAADLQPNRLSWEISANRRVTLEVPAGLTDEERAYVGRLISHLLRIE